MQSSSDQTPSADEKVEEKVYCGSEEKRISSNSDTNGSNDDPPASKKQKLSDPIDNKTSIPFSSQLSLDGIRKMQSEFCKERDWDQYHTPRNVLLAMVGEVGEVSELFQWRGECQKGLPDWSEKDKKHLGQELSDVLIYLVRLADRCHVDLPQAVLDKFKHNGLKYPADKVKGSSKKYTEYKEAARSSQDE